MKSTGPFERADDEDVLKLGFKDAKQQDESMPADGSLGFEQEHLKNITAA